MKKLIFLFAVIGIVSCKSGVKYIDAEAPNNELAYEPFKLILEKDYNIVELNKTKPVKVGDNTMYHMRYRLRIPKNLVNWSIKGRKYIFEYDDKEIIAIDGGYTSSPQKEQWELRDSINYGILKPYIENYSADRAYGDNYLKNYLDSVPADRVTKMYSNGATRVLLFNIKEKNFDSYFNLIKTIEYIE